LQAHHTIDAQIATRQLTLADKRILDLTVKE
jgi:hypothetical protein